MKGKNIKLLLTAAKLTCQCASALSRHQACLRNGAAWQAKPNAELLPAMNLYDCLKFFSLHLINFFFPRTSQFINSNFKHFCLQIHQTTINPSINLSTPGPTYFNSTSSLVNLFQSQAQPFLSIPIVHCLPRVSQPFITQFHSSDYTLPLSGWFQTRVSTHLTRSHSWFAQRKIFSIPSTTSFSTLSPPSKTFFPLSLLSMVGLFIWFVHIL